MKRILLFLVFTISLFCCFSCSGQEALNEEFREFLKGYYDVKEGSILYISENFKFSHPSFEMEEDYGEYHIIANIIVSEEYEWTTPLRNIKKDMANFADAFVDFAKAKEIDNDYYLYVSAGGLVTSTFVYDYEKDVLYIPQDYDLYCEMYSKFGTTFEHTISNTEEGVRWLVQKGFGEMKHKEYESKNLNILQFPWVYIDSDGEFGASHLYWTFE